MKKIIKILILIIIIFFIMEKAYELGMHKIYSIKYSEHVYKYAEEYGVDPLLVFSIIKAESNFKPDAKSIADAYGLMQLREPTAKEVAEQLKIEYSLEILYDPEINIKLGTKYFSNLLKLYNGNINLSIIAYNAGQTNVKKWIENETIKPDGSDIENVPFKETNMYIRKILRDYRIYKNLWEEQ